MYDDEFDDEFDEADFANEPLGSRVSRTSRVAIVAAIAAVIAMVAAGLVVGGGEGDGTGSGIVGEPGASSVASSP